MVFSPFLPTYLSSPLDLLLPTGNLTYSISLPNSKPFRIAFPTYPFKTIKILLQDAMVVYFEIGDVVLY